MRDYPLTSPTDRFNKKDYVRRAAGLYGWRTAGLPPAVGASTAW